MSSGTNRRRFLKRGAAAAVVPAMAPLLSCAPAGSRPEWRPESVASDRDFWRMVRAQFPLTRERVYLNTGGLGPAPYQVLDAVESAKMELQRLSETGYSLIEEAREPVAEFFGVRPTEVAFMRNATEGNAIVAAGLDLRPGDEVIFESHAHPGGYLCWMNMRKLKGIRIRLFEPDPESPEANIQRISDLITDRTRVIQVSHVTAPTGLRFPVEEIARLARERDVWFHIDGAQSAGMFPVDVWETGCDSYATSGHKWMMGPHGTGLLFVRHERLEDVNPVLVGAYSDERHELPDVFDYFDGARRYEYGTRDASQVVGLRAAVNFLNDIGMERIEAHGREMATYLHEELSRIGGVTVLTPADPSMRGAMTTIRADQVRYDDLFRFLLEEYQLRARVVTEQDLNALRISTHVFNSLDECERVVEAVREAVRRA